MIGFELIKKIQEIITDKYNLVPLIGVEIEFYILPNDKENDAEKLIRIIETEMKIEIQKERGKGQYEFTIAPESNFVNLTNKINQYKEIILNVCHKNTAHMQIDFSPKPLNNDYGSSAQYNLTLHKIKEKNHGLNIFSKEAKFEDNRYIMYVINGILELLETRWEWLISSNAEAEKKRMEPGWMAPTNVSWGGNNRTTAIRIPDSNSENRRIEFRVPSPITAPEKVILLLLQGILVGLEKQKYPKIPRSYGNAH